MKVYHRPEIDFVSIDFKDEPEAKSVFENGIIVRYDKKGNVIGLDITNSAQFFLGAEDITFAEACKILGVSDSTLRRIIKSKKIPAKKPNGKDYRFNKSDVIKYKMAS
jgi:excisionase family DNA binding protein